MSSPQIGWWWAECCIHDLLRVETQSDLQDLLERLSPEEVGEIGRPGVWPVMTREILAELTPPDDEFGKGIAFAIERFVLGAKPDASEN